MNHIHKIHDLGRNSYQSLLKFGSTIAANHLQLFPKSKGLILQIKENFFFKSVLLRIDTRQNFLTYLRNIIKKPPWKLILLSSYSITKLYQGKARVNLGFVQINPNSILLHSLQLKNPQIPLESDNNSRLKQSTITENRWRGKALDLLTFFIRWLIQLSSSTIVLGDHLILPVDFCSMDLTENPTSITSMDNISQSSGSTKHGRVKRFKPDENTALASSAKSSPLPQLRSHFTSQIRDISSLFHQATQFQTHFPGEDTLANIFITDNPIQREQIHRLLEEIILNRSDPPPLPDIFRDLILNLFESLETAHASKEEDVFRALGDTWSLLRPTTEQTRLDILGVEHTLLLALPTKLGVSVRQSQSLVRQLDAVYISSKTAVIEEYRQLHMTVVQTFPINFQSWASTPIVLSGNDVTETVPMHMRNQLAGLADGRQWTAYPHSQVPSSVWFTPNKARLMSPPPAATPSGLQHGTSNRPSIWGTNSTTKKVQTAAPPVVLRPPILLNPKELSAIQHQTLLHRSAGITTRPITTIPETLRDHEALIACDEYIEVTRFLLVLNFRRVMDLPQAENMARTLAEAQHIVRTFGIFSEHANTITNIEITRHYNNGLILDSELLESNIHNLVLDPDPMGTCQSVILVLKSPGRFGTATAEPRGAQPAILPLVQRIISLTPSPGEIDHTMYVVQAIPEYAVPECLPHKRYNLAVCRGIPICQNSSPITATCLIAFRDKVKETCTNLGILPQDDIPGKFVVLIGHVSHYVQTTGKGPGSTNNFIIPVKNGVIQRTSTGKSANTPPIKIRNELILRAVWLGNFFDKDLQLYTRLQSAFNSDPVIAFKAFGVPLELLASREMCVKHPIHLSDTDAHIHYTAMSNIRPYLPVRLLLSTLLEDPMIKATIDRHLLAAFILPEAQSLRGQPNKWTALFIWDAPVIGIDPHACRTLANTAANGLPEPLRPLQIDLEKADFWGLSEFRGIGKAYTNVVRSQTSNKPSYGRTGGQQSSRAGRQQATAPKLQFTSTMVSPYAETYSATDAAGSLHHDLSNLVNTKFQQQDDSNSDSDSSSSGFSGDPIAEQMIESTATIDETTTMQKAIAEAVTTATAHLEAQLKLQQDTNVALTTKLNNLAENTHTVIQSMQEEARTERLRNKTLAVSQQWSKKFEERQQTAQEIEMREAEKIDLEAQGVQVPQSILTRLRQLTTIAEKQDQQLSTLYLTVQTQCAHLGDDITLYIDDSTQP